MVTGKDHTPNGLEHFTLTAAPSAKSSIDSLFAAFSFGKAVSTFSENALARFCAAVPGPARPSRSTHTRAKSSIVHAPSAGRTAGPPQNRTRVAIPLIALTGATGFIGQHLLRRLPVYGHRVRVLLRRPADAALGAASAVIGDLTRPRNMSAALEGVEAVIHSAGLAHTATGQPESDYRQLNTEATVALGQAAQRAGVRRFVFLSSIRAQTGPTAADVVTEERAPQPTDAYGRSKLAAEQGLAGLDIDWVALRPVLVYGHGVKGNMAKLMQLARSPYPLPFAGLAARRSLLSLDNLTSAIAAVLAADGRMCRPFIVTDAGPLTIGEMIVAMRAGLGRKPRLVPMPELLLRVAFQAARRQEAYERLAGSLVADASALRRLGWTPAVRTVDALADLMRDESRQRAFWPS